MTDDNTNMMALAMAAGRVLGDPVDINGHKLAVVPDGYRIETLEGYQDHPSHIRQTVAVQDVESFCRYFATFMDSNSAIFADQKRMKLTAVLDHHGKGTPRPGYHHLTYDAPRSEEWERWTSKDGSAMSQAEFIRWIEENLADIVEPDGATILEIARHLEAKKNVHFVSGERLSDGQRQLVYKEEIDATTAKGNVRIPEKFILGLPVFHRGPHWKVEAFLRYRINEGKLVFAYELHRRRYIEDEAFGELVKEVSKTIPGPPLLIHGTFERQRRPV